MKRQQHFSEKCGRLLGSMRSMQLLVPVLLRSVSDRQTVQNLCRQQYWQGRQVPRRHSAASASRRCYQIAEVSIRQRLQALRSGLHAPRETWTISGFGHLLQRFCANVFSRSSSTGRTYKNNSTWGMENKCQMAASLSCAPRKLALNWVLKVSK